MLAHATRSAVPGVTITGIPGNRPRFIAILVAMNREISVVIVHDDELVGAGVAALCERIAAVKVIGRANTGREGLVLIEKLVPTVALVDILLPDFNGIDTATHVRGRRIATRIVILTGYPEEELFLRAMDAGVSGYLLKSSAEQELALAIHAAANGKVYVTPDMSPYPWTKQSDRLDSKTQQRLTLRQRETLYLVAQGKTSKEIAVMMNVTVKTVEKHRAELMRRLRVASLAIIHSDVATGDFHPLQHQAVISHVSKSDMGRRRSDTPSGAQLFATQAMS